MPHIIRNHQVEIHIDLPGENYQFSRFDWSGKITKATLRGIPVSTIERRDGLDENLFGKGFYNEFGIETALGYEDAQPGEWFHKIGVGLLKREEGPYDFSRSYEIRPATFETETGTDKALIICRSAYHNGYAYVLKKEILANPEGFHINYELQNLGEKRIITDEYIHNFLAINQEPMGRSYDLSFPFEMKPEAFGEMVNPEEKVLLGRHNISFNASPQQQFFFSQMGGRKDVQASWELSCRKSRVGIREKGSFSCAKVNVWGWGHVVCPELFHSINLPPGETSQWTRTYEFFENQMGE